MKKCREIPVEIDGVDSSVCFVQVSEWVTHTKRNEQRFERNSNCECIQSELQWDTWFHKPIMKIKCEKQRR
jgi:hypothetical protein